MTFPDMTIGESLIPHIPKLLEVIKRHNVIDPILGETLAQASGLKSSVEVRALVSHLRVVEGAPIASQGNGYFWATKPEEMDETIEHIEKRLTRLRRVLRSLRNTQLDMAAGIEQRGVFE